MADVPKGVLVVFYTRYGAAEQLGLAAGIGALNGRANIRLRRLADSTDAATIDADPKWKQNLARLQRDYVTPRPADPVWADVIVFVAPAGMPGEVEEYIASLPALGPMSGKFAVVLAVDRDRATLDALEAAATAAGFIVVPEVASSGDARADARTHGRRATDLATAKTREGY